MGAVFGGLGVGLSPREQHQPVDLTLGKSLGPFPEHVLDKMGQARLAWRLVERADRVVQVAHHDRRAAHGQNQGPQTVIQPAFSNRQIVKPGGGEGPFQRSSHKCPSLTSMGGVAGAGLAAGDNDRATSITRSALRSITSQTIEGGLPVNKPRTKRRSLRLIIRPFCMLPLNAGDRCPTMQGSKSSALAKRGSG